MDITNVIVTILGVTGFVIVAPIVLFLIAFTVASIIDLVMGLSLIIIGLLVGLCYLVVSGITFLLNAIVGAAVGSYKGIKNLVTRTRKEG